MSVSSRVCNVPGLEYIQRGQGMSMMHVMYLPPPPPSGLNNRRLWKHYLPALLFVVKCVSNNSPRLLKSAANLCTCERCRQRVIADGHGPLCVVYINLKIDINNFLVAGNQDNVNRVFNCTVRNLMVPNYRDSQYSPTFPAFLSVFSYFFKKTETCPVFCVIFLTFPVCSEFLTFPSLENTLYFQVFQS